jgi:Ca-activated chloride channel family protein
MWSRENEGTTLVKDYKPLVFSPIVIASWGSYVSKRGIRGFGSLHELSTKDHSDLKFAHTDPQLSNSGFMAMIMEIAAAAGKNPSQLTVEDLLSSGVRRWLTELESTVVYYGESTGFLLDEAVEVGPDSLNALVMYENLVIEKNRSGEPMSRWRDRIVAVYPEEGLLLSDHPFCILNAPWVDEKQRWAAQEFLRFLLNPEIQKKAVTHGFRPTTAGIELDRDVFNSANGVSYLLPTSILSTPTDGDVLWHVTDIWSVTRARR